MGLVLDIIFLLALVGILPLYIHYRRRRLSDPARINAAARYFKTIIIAVILMTLLGLSWAVNGRTLSDLGLGPPGRSGIAGILIAAAIILGLFITWRLLKPPAELAQKDIDEAARILPNSRQELWVYLVYAIFAGFAWEVFYRGALLYYFTPYLGQAMSIVLAALIYAIGNGTTMKRCAENLMTALVLLIFFVLTKSLWGPILLHIGLPLLALITARRMTATL